MNTRRSFLRTATLGSAAALATPAIVHAQAPIRCVFKPTQELRSASM